MPGREAGRKELRSGITFHQAALMHCDLVVHKQWPFGLLQPPLFLLSLGENKKAHGRSVLVTDS